MLSNFGETLKRIYKASQEKKENSSPRGAEWFLFYLTAPSSVFQKRVSLCNRILLTAFVFCLAFAFRVPVFTSGSWSFSSDHNHLCEQLGAHEAQYALFRRRGRSSNQRTGMSKTATWPTRLPGQIDSPLPPHSVSSFCPRRRNSA